MNNSMECVAYLFADSGLPKLDFSIVTSVNFAFAIPTPEGHVRPLENAPLARAAVEAAHAWGRKICLSLGGWSYEEIPLEATFCQATDTPEKRQLLADEIVAMARAYDFDGVDVDWEYPRVSSGSKAQYEDFLRRLRAQLPVGEKLLTAAILAGLDSKNEPITDAAEAIGTPAVALLDRINLMTYDCDGPVHSSYAFAENCLNYWLDTRHFPPEKLTLGLPFYGRPFPGAFKDLLLADPDALEKDTVEMPHGSVHYNGRETLTKKVALAKERLLAGIMFWEISLDADDPQKSLLKVLGEAMNA